MTQPKSPPSVKKIISQESSISSRVQENYLRPTVAKNAVGILTYKRYTCQCSTQCRYLLVWNVCNIGNRSAQKLGHLVEVQLLKPEIYSSNLIHFSTFLVTQQPLTTRKLQHKIKNKFLFCVIVFDSVSCNCSASSVTAVGLFA